MTTSTQAALPTPSPLDRLADFGRRQPALVALLLIGAAASIRYETFLTPENLANVLRQNSMPGLLALGMMFSILSGGLDLSVGALMAVGGVTAAALSGTNAGVAVGAAVAATTFLGCCNGLIVAGARVQPFIATLVMNMAARGVLLAWTAEQTIRVARTAAGLKWLGRGWVGPVPVPALVMFAAFATAGFVLGHTRAGRHVYAVGDGEESARLMGLNVFRVQVGVYAASGALAGLAGVLLAARVGAGQPTAGLGWELNAITAVVLGLTSLAGGRGGAGSTLVGLLLLAVIYNIFNLEGDVNSYWQWVLRGAFLLLVVVVQNQVRRVAARAGAAR